MAYLIVSQWIKNICNILNICTCASMIILHYKYLKLCDHNRNLITLCFFKHTHKQTKTLNVEYLSNYIQQGEFQCKICFGCWLFNWLLHDACFMYFIFIENKVRKKYIISKTLISKILILCPEQNENHFVSPYNSLLMPNDSL